MQTTYNFCAGPAMLPAPVMQRAQKEFIDWNGNGTSVMEVSHRGKPFMEVAHKAEQDLRTLLAVPSNYKVLFLQGGGRGQFFSVPMNLAKQEHWEMDEQAAYFHYCPNETVDGIEIPWVPVSKSKNVPIVADTR